MSLFFESIKIQNGVICNLKYHNIRLNKTLHDIYKIKSNLNLEEFIKPPSCGLFKCKVIYGEQIKEISFTPYHVRKIDSFKLIHSDIMYNYKSTNRLELDYLFEQRDGNDDIIIVKNGLLSDTSIANIALYNGIKWFTPKTPLLKGTMRAKLIEDKIIFEKDLKIKDLEKSTKFAIINAMISFKEIRYAKYVFT